MNKEEFITEDDITKALADLELDTEIENDDITKGDDNDDDDDDDDDDEKKPTNAKVEGEGDEGDDDDTEKGYTAVKGQKGLYSKGGSYYTKGKGGYIEMSEKALAKAGYQIGGKAISAADTSTKSNTKAISAAITKGEEFNLNADGLTREEVEGDLEKGLDDDDFQKGLELNPMMAKFNESLNKIADNQDMKSKATGTILKGMMEQMSNLSEQVAKMAGTSQGRKSATATSKPVERFSKGEGEGDTQTLSISQNRGQILEVMDNLTFKGETIDNDMSKAMTYFEANGILSQSTALRIEKEAGFQITK